MLGLIGPIEFYWEVCLGKVRTIIFSHFAKFNARQKLLVDRSQTFLMYFFVRGVYFASTDLSIVCFLK